MRFIADLHVHSRFSRATSRDMSLKVSGSQLKGITVVGTGDLHPNWYQEMKENLNQ
jgi:PHP family Zn ribbon phosphoesterase